MKKYGFIILFFVACTASVFGQKEVTKTRKLSFKLYGQVIAETQPGSSTVGFGNFSPAISFSKDTRFNHEFQVTDFNFKGVGGNDVSRSVTHSNVRLVNLGLRYSYNRLLLTHKKFDFFVGGGLATSFSSAHYAAVTSTSFPYTNTDVGVDLNLTPRFVWNFSPKFYLDINVPLNAYSLNYNTRNDNNPLLPVGARRTTQIDGDVFPNKYTVNVGVGIRF